MKAEIPTTVPVPSAPAARKELPHPRTGGKAAGDRMLRRLKTGLTIGLVLTGLGAWAAALVQPWAAHGGDPGVVTVPAPALSEERIRAVASEGERLPPRKTTQGCELVRNPFLGHAQAAEAGPTPETPVPAPAAVAPTPAAPKPSEVLAAVKALHLDMTLTGAGGERWAVINGHDYREGDSVGGLRLAEVQEGKVKLEQGGIVCLLQMD